MERNDAGIFAVEAADTVRSWREGAPKVANVPRRQAVPAVAAWPAVRPVRIVCQSFSSSRSPQPASLTTLLLPRSATYTFPSLSVATASGVLRPLNDNTVGAFASGANFTTLLAS
jgi:hypothetical protein